MAPRAPKPKEEGSSTPTPEVLKPKTEKAKVEKTKAEPKAKVKTEKAPKAEKAPKEKAEKVVKPKTEKDAKEKVEKKKIEKGAGAGVGAGAGKGGGKEGEKKEKVKPVTGDEAVVLIVEYLRAQNRPFSATEVSANLHGKVTKTVADKILKEMGEKKTLGMNSTNQDKKGSQFVFWTPQDPADAASPEELALMDATISTLKASNPTLKSTLKARTAKLAVLKSAPTTPELQNMVDTLRTQNAAKAEKLASFKSGNVQMFSKEEMAAVEKAFKYWGARRRARKAAYEELEYAVMGSGKSREEIREDCGVEVD